MRQAFLSLILFFLTLQPGWAQFGKPHTSAELILASDQVTPGSELKAAFRLTMEPGWHTYWKYPGEVGLPTEAKWELPQGWSAEPLEWPAPHFLETAGLVSYAYEKEVLIPVRLKVSPQAVVGKSVPIKVDLNWLECKETCVPGESSLEGTVKVAAQEAPSAQRKIVEDAFAALPPSSDQVIVQRSGGELLISLPPDFTASEVRFFPDSKGQIIDTEAQLIQGSAPTRTLHVKADPESKQLTSVSGLLSQEGKAVSFRAEIGKTAVSSGVKTAALATIIFTSGAAFLGGLVLNLMPCVFPVLSLKVLGIVEQSRSEGRPAWHHGVVFTLGVLLSFWVMSGVLLVVRSAGEEVGWGYHLQNPLMIATLAILFLLISLNLFGVFEVGENLTQLSGVAEQKEGFAHSFWSGVLTTLAATPCTAPFMGSAVGFALSQPSWVALLIFSCLALGVAAPYMTLTMFPKLLEKLPKPGPWMVTFKQILAFPMMLAVIWLAWVFGGQMGTDKMALFLVALLGVAMAGWIYGRWGTSFEPKEKRYGLLFSALVIALSLSTTYRAAQATPGADRWQPYSPELVARLKEEGKPFFLDFTADWCTSCKANELIALSRGDVLDRFQELEVTLVKADWTRKDPVITAALAEYGRAGVPLYVLYPGQGAEPEVLPEVLLPSTVLTALDTLKAK